MEGGAAIHLAGASDGKHAGAGGGAILGIVNINSITASAVLEVYDGQSTNGTKIARIDASTLAGSPKEYYVRCPNGVYAVLTGGGDATVTVF
ncbi:MAG TPA: hypothetical protein VFA96_07235 [Nocardioides sp.]|nr:hypothetical protein [Nocardioides sp.]